MSASRAGMLVWNILGFLVSVFFLVKGAEFAVKHVTVVARHYRISEFVVSFVVVGFVSTFPEFFVLIMSALDGTHTLGLGTVLGNNITDLTLVLGLIALSAGALRVESREIRHDFVFVLLTLLPVVLALDGELTRVDGFILLIAGAGYIRELVRDSKAFSKVFKDGFPGTFVRSAILFGVSLGVVLLSSWFVVRFAEGLAADLELPLLVVGLVIVALGATLPELTFGIRAAMKGTSNLALGQLLGCVILDATIVIGIVALVSPFTLAIPRVAMAGIFTAVSAGIAVWLLGSEKGLTRLHGIVLVLLYVLFAVTQFIAAKTPLFVP
jgi:cation:H+ antiporter